MTEPNQLPDHTAELQEAAEHDRTLPETRLRRLGTLASHFLKRQNKTAEVNPVEEFGSGLAERSRRILESRNRSILSEMDVRIAADRRAGRVTRI